MSEFLNDNKLVRINQIEFTRCICIYQVTFRVIYPSLHTIVHINKTAMDGARIRNRTPCLCAPSRRSGWARVSYPLCGGVERSGECGLQS